ncbi:GlsB/YeaQ/YmgE family stress response membrane protein [Kordiimonas aquimaris]|uniref:GlsB/YeaQ/YmgE family stress response membrane protein n=1 Tax=Kordiimonas aquimaris TaxID=707591 RepID=UPI0021CFDF36|nr:GlsB/YeaQ/YmgE family stress response membrane protein [Kordiimonas aquimaris]
MIGAILIGAAAGYFAGHILRGRGYGALGNIVLGVLGGVLGDLAFGALGLGPHNLIGDLISATVGSVVLVYFFGKKKHGGRDDD